MTDDEFDAALVSAAFSLGGEEGWRKLTAGSAARHAGLDLARARARFPGRGAVLRRFGALADAHALTGAVVDGTVKDRLFDILLRRFDFLQMHRAGVVALMRALPVEPAWGAWLSSETLKSMGWMLEGAGVSSRGLRGEVAKRGLAVVWAWGMRAWLRDETEDLSTTMAAVDVALARADQIASRLSRNGFVPESESAAAEPPGPGDGELTIVPAPDMLGE
jgi:hypothetical protein